MHRYFRAQHFGFAFFIAMDALGSEASTSMGFVELEPHVVTANPFVTSLEELVVPADELSGEALRRKSQASLGATLDGRPGVHSSYDGPGAGRPVVRGFDGDRVRILNQGTDSFDVSQTSPDHGVGIEPLFAEEIEVVRGPATLLYGNAAIGGVVNVLGKELPRRAVERPISGELESSYGTAADEKTAGLALQGGEGAFAWSAGYLERRSKDYRIPGYAESRYLRQRHEHEEGHHEQGRHDDHSHEDDLGSFGVLENSFAKTRTGYLGLGWFGDRASIAASYSRLGSDYGVPSHAHDHAEGEEHGDHDEQEEHNGEGDHHLEEDAEVPVRIDLDQSRFSLRGEWLDAGALFESLELQFGYGDYRHMEWGGDEVGTTFNRDGFELRLTGVHQPLGDFTGAIGFQVKEDTLEAVGEEAFIPSNQTHQHGLFIVERLNRSWGAWEFGGRLESVSVLPHASELASCSFATGTASAGVVRRVGEGASVSANLSYAERAPNASELYAMGPHVGTRSFEIGDPALGKERSVNLDASYRLSAGRVTGAMTLFYSDFSDYIYMQYLDPEALGSEYEDLDTEGMDARRAVSADARFYGYELDLRFHLIDAADRALHFDLLVDQTRAANDRFGTELPRIPPRRYGGRIEYAAGPWLMGVEGRYHEAASRLAPNELPSDHYLLWGADIRYRIRTTDTAVVDLFVVGRNLGNEEARPRTSFLKDLAPMPGRDVRLGLRTRF